MRKLISIFILLFFVTFPAISQNGEASKIVGSYMTEKNKAKVSITQKGNMYYGTIIWTHVPNAMDAKNPDKNECKKKIVGKLILKDFVYSGDNVWEKGTIYDPESGKTYSCKITRKSNGNLNVRGFIGVSLFGRNTEWTLVKN